MNLHVITAAVTEGVPADPVIQVIPEAVTIAAADPGNETDIKNFCITNNDFGTKMKKILALAAFLITLNFTGCYTVIWSPGDEFPAANNSGSDNSNINSTGGSNDGYYYDGRDGGRYYNPDYYYDPVYYGPYSGYYGNPWWYSVNPSNYNETKKENNNRDKNSSTVRNNDGSGRNRDDRRGDIINNAPPTKTSGSTTTTGTVTKSSGGSDSSSNSSTRNSSNETKKSDTNTIRNNDGGRNTDRGKR